MLYNDNESQRLRRKKRMGNFILRSNSPSGNFDFNVVIRSILYNQEKKYVSFSVGSAITSLSIPEMEYEECILKAKAMFAVLQ